MATGINTVKMSALKVDLLNYTENIKSLIERLDDCCTSVRTNLVGPGNSEIISQLDIFKEQFSIVSSNISSYIKTLNQIEKKFEDNDAELASDLIRNISKLEQ